MATANDVQTNKAFVSIAVIHHRHGIDVLAAQSDDALWRKLARWALEYVDEIHEDDQPKVRAAVAASRYEDAALIYFESKQEHGRDDEYLDFFGRTEVSDDA